MLKVLLGGLRPLGSLAVEGDLQHRQEARLAKDQETLEGGLRPLGSQAVEGDLQHRQEARLAKDQETLEGNLLQLPNQGKNFTKSFIFQDSFSQEACRKDHQNRM